MKKQCVESIVTTNLTLTLTVHKIISYVLSKQCQQSLSLCLYKPSRLLVVILSIRSVNGPNACRLKCIRTADLIR